MCLSKSFVYFGEYVVYYIGEGDRNFIIFSEK